MDQTLFISDGHSKIRDALVDAASYLGLKHNGWHDIGMVTIPYIKKFVLNLFFGKRVFFALFNFFSSNHAKRR
jgi:hypothetical protein